MQIVAALVVGFLLGPLAANATDLAERVQIEVQGNWGSVPRENVHKVLMSVAEQLLQFCPDRRPGKILVRYRDECPITLYEKGPEGQHQIRLNVRGTYWAQYAYQFSHELSHVLCNYDRRKAGRNLWFEECVCETSSLFTMRKMAVAWKTAPPYANWASFAPHLDQYVDAILARRDRRLPPDRTMAQWYREHADALAGQRHLTDDSKLAAAYLVALFEDDPTGWECLACLNLGSTDAELDFGRYLEGWKDRVPQRNRGFVEKVQRLFGVAGAGEK
jgi:hypothetical protein